MHELINLRPRDGALRPVGQKTPVTLAAEDIRFIHSINQNTRVYIGVYTDPNTLSYWVETISPWSIGEEVVTAIPNEDLAFASLKNTLIVSDRAHEITYTLIFNTDTSLYEIFNPLFPADFPRVEFQRLAVAADNETKTFNASMDTDYGDAKLAEYVKMQKNKADKGYLSGKVLVRYALELFDGILVKHSLPDLVQLSDITTTSVFNPTLFGDTDHPGWVITTVFNAYKLQYKFTGTLAWLTTFKAKYENIIRSLKIYVSLPRSPEVVDAGRQTQRGREHSGYLNLNVQSWRITFDAENLKDYTPDPITETYFLLKDIKLDDLKDTSVGFLDVAPDKETIIDLATRPQMTIDNFSHHTIFANSLFTYNERIFLGDIKNNLSPGLPAEEVIFNSGTTTDPQTYDVCLEFDIITDSGTKTVNSGWKTLNTYDIPSLGHARFQLGYNTIGCYIGYPDSRATKMRVLMRLTGRSNIYRAYETGLTVSAFNNYAVTPGRLVQLPMAITAQSLSALSTKSNYYYDHNRVQATELNNPFCYPAINSYRLGLGQVLGLSTNAIALSQGQFGQYPIFVFTSDGIWTMNIGTGETLISAIANISRLVCNNPEGITPLDGGTAFPTSKGLFVITGVQKPELSEAAEGQHTSRITSLAAYDTISDDANYYQIKSLLCQTDFRSYLANAVIGYDYQHNEIIVSNITYPYSWVFSLENKLWFKISESFRRFVNDYPVCYGIKEDEEITTTTPAPTTTEGPTTTEPPTTTTSPTTTEAATTEAATTTIEGNIS